MRGRAVVGMVFVGACWCVQAQWLNQPTPDAPRMPDGEVDMTGPVPRVNGKPDLSGIWQVEAESRGTGLFGLGESPNSKYFRDILSDFKPGEEPLTPASREIFRQRSQPGVVGPSLICLPDGVPHADLLPEPFKILQMPGEIVMLYVESHRVYHQCVPVPGPHGIPQPGGRRIVGMLASIGEDLAEDGLHFVEQLLPDTDVFEHICYENEKDAAHVPGRAPR